MSATYDPNAKDLPEPPRRRVDASALRAPGVTERLGQYTPPLGDICKPGRCMLSMKPCASTCRLSPRRADPVLPKPPSIPQAR